MLMSLFLEDKGGLPLGLLSVLGFCISPGAYDKNSIYLSLMFLLNMSEQGRIAQVGFTTGALVISSEWFESLDRDRFVSKNHLL